LLRERETERDRETKRDKERERETERESNTDRVKIRSRKGETQAKDRERRWRGSR
jgi:hypothetical protein